MTLRQAFASALHFFVVFLFFSAGVFCLLLPHLPEFRFQTADWLVHEGEGSGWLATGFFLLSALFLSGFYSFNRGRFLHIKMGTRQISLDAKAIRQTLEETFKQVFPKQLFLQEVVVGQGAKLEIGIRLAPLEEGLREELFVRAEKHLETLLQERFGYSRPFSLFVRL